MPWKHIQGPVVGMITNESPARIDARATPYTKGCYLKDGEVHTDFGMSNYPVPSGTQSNTLLGTVMKITTFRLFSGVSYELAFTTRYLYQYNTTTKTWDVVIQGTLLDNAESIWSSPIDSFTVLLLHMDGTDASTTFTDSSPTGRTMTAVGGAQIDTAQSVFGSASGLFDGTGDYLTAPDSADFAFASGDFTIDFRVRFNSLANACFYSQDTGGTNANYCQFAYDNVNHLLLIDTVLASVTQLSFTVPFTPSTNTWYHLALVRSTNTWMVFVDGVLKINTLVGGAYANAFPNFTGLVWVGARSYPADQSLNGWLDEFRVSKGVARWTSGFTIPATAYPTEVVVSADTTIKIRGTSSSKNVISSSFTTGIATYRNNGGAIDISAAANKYLSFWIYSTVAFASGVFRFRLSEQNAGGTGATYADYTVPAVAAGAWQHVSVAISTPVASNGGGTFPTDLNAVLSVALVAQSDPGALTIYIDDVRTAKEFTGDEDNKFSVTTQADKMIFTNGVDPIGQLVDSSGVVHTELTLTLPTGALTTSEVVLAFKDHVLYMNNTENGADVPQRVSWSNIGSVSDMILGTAGFQDLFDDDSWILGAAILSENEVAIYKERSIIQCVWIGGHTPFRFTTIVLDEGILNKDCIANVSGYHIVVGPSRIYAYNGTNDLKSIDDSIKTTLYNRLDGTYAPRVFCFLIVEDDELQVFIPVAQTTPDEGWCLYLNTKSWYIKDRNISCAGFYTEQTSKTIGDLVGTIGEQNYTIGSTLNKAFTPITLVGDVSGKVYKLDKSSSNNGSTAISSEFQTPDFVLPDTDDYMNKFMRVGQLIYEVAGQTITTEWSEDSGLSWNPTQGNGTNIQALTSVYTSFQQDFETASKKIRFRFKKSTVSKGFHLRAYGFEWKARTGRR